MIERKKCVHPGRHHHFKRVVVEKKTNKKQDVCLEGFSGGEVSSFPTPARQQMDDSEMTKTTTNGSFCSPARPASCLQVAGVKSNDSGRGQDSLLPNKRSSVYNLARFMIFIVMKA